MGHAVLAPQPGPNWRAAAGGGGGAGRGAQPVRWSAFPRGEQAQDLPAARRENTPGLHVHHAAEIRNLLLAGQ